MQISIFLLLAHAQHGKAVDTIKADTVPVRTEVQTEKSPSDQVEGRIYPEGVKLHPALAHFAMAFPFFLALLEVMYLLKGRPPDLIEGTSVFITSAAVVSATLSGTYAHNLMYDLPISAEAESLLHTHENFGLLLAGVFGLLLLLRLVYVFLPNRTLRYVFLILLLVSLPLVLYQGFMGGRLVYDFGVGVR